MIEKLLLLNIKPKRKIFIYINCIIIFIVFIILSFKIEIYDSYQTTGILKCINEDCNIELTLYYEKINILEQDPQIEYLGNFYKIYNIEYSDPYLNNNLIYQDIKLKSDIHGDERIINLKILYNKQRIIDKIKNII